VAGAGGELCPVFGRPGPASIPLLFCRRGFVFLCGCDCKRDPRDGWMEGVADQGIGASGLPIAPPAAPSPVCLFVLVFSSLSRHSSLFFSWESPDDVFLNSTSILLAHGWSLKVNAFAIY
jgi:hypothetical protein